MRSNGRGSEHGVARKRWDLLSEYVWRILRNGARLWGRLGRGERVLSEENKNALWIPPGFAHGFLSLTETVDFQYWCSDVYDPESERTIDWNDPEIGITWPLDRIAEGQLSDKDRERGLSLGEISPLVGW